MRRAPIVLVAVCLVFAVDALARAGVPRLDWFEGDLGQVLHVSGMTFVASKDSSNEIVLRAERTRFYPERQVADLERVEVEVAPGDGRTGFEMRCDEGRLNLATHAFVAEGNVLGTIEGGREFEAVWVAYDEEAGVLYTDDPVLITDEGGRYRGGGFRYFVDERRFRLEGGATVVQEP
jgi:LPS export ABC transporter protein LptC